MNVKFVKLSSSARIPYKAHPTDAGYDLYASMYVEIAPMQRAIVPTALSVAIPEGYYGRIAPRSGLAIKNGIDVLAGVVDPSYRGPVGVVLINLNYKKPNSEVGSYENIMGDSNTFKINEGDRIAQLIIEKYHSVEFEEVLELEESDRGESGFGSTGL